MASVGQQITVTTSATLIFEVIDAATYDTLSNPAANIFRAREPSDPLPLLLTFPAGATVLLGGSGVTSGTGCPLVGPAMLPYNVTASDSLYGIVGSSTAVVGVLAQRQ
jgi:hypothetical protein